MARINECNPADAQPTPGLFGGGPGWVDQYALLVPMYQEHPPEITAAEAELHALEQRLAGAEERMALALAAGDGESYSRAKVDVEVGPEMVRGATVRLERLRAEVLGAHAGDFDAVMTAIVAKREEVTARRKALEAEEAKLNAATENAGSKATYLRHLASRAEETVERLGTKAGAQAFEAGRRYKADPPPMPQPPENFTLTTKGNRLVAFNGRRIG